MEPLFKVSCLVFAVAPSNPNHLRRAEYVCSVFPPIFTHKPL